MNKIITKTVKEKAYEWINKKNAIKIHETKQNETTVITYAKNGSETVEDFEILKVICKDDNVLDAFLYTFKDMAIFKHLVPYEPSTYNFYAWIEMNSDHVSADDFYHWIGGEYFDEYFFELYADYLMYQKEQGGIECITKQLEPDFKEITLAESLKNSFSDVFDKDEWAKVLTDAFHEENSGQGVWLVRSDSSFYEKGYSYTYRTQNHAYIIMVNSNIWEKVIEYVNDEGFLLYSGTTNVYGSGCVQGKRVTLY